MVSAEELFREMEECLREQERIEVDAKSCSSCSTVDPEDEDQENYPVYYLPDGDVHICRGCKCDRLVLNDDSFYICEVTGIVHFASQAAEPTESVTGHKPSNCPDDHAGTPVGGAWRPRRDMFALSQAAYLAAKTMDDSGKTLYVDKVSEAKAAPKPLQKRGARCVDDPTPKSNPAPKRVRINKREIVSRDSFTSLVDEASSILSKLCNFDKKVCPKTKANSKLLDENFLFAAAVKKYVKECLSTGQPPTFDAVHNLSILAQSVAAEENRKLQLQETKSPLILHSLIRSLCAKLVVTLWVGSCKTPYMSRAKRGTDSFRPFACGVFYALKRGVALPDGRIVVPSLPAAYTDALPALRATAQNSLAKTLHSSSHRGLCTLHRCIASVVNTSVYNDAAQAATELAKAVRHV